MLHSLLRQMQKALTFELEKEFVNIKGKHERFNSFITSSLDKLISMPLTKIDLEKLASLSDKYNLYTSMSLRERKSLVIRSRKLLYDLSQSYKINDPVSKPNIILKNESTSKYNTFSKLEESSLLTSINGIGHKFAETLSRLGLFTVRDLLFYFPRDYLDYSIIKRISELQIGERATILAKVTKCNSFISPRNKNLSILTIHIQDITGNIQVTKFFAGKRLSNKAFLKSQERQYPKGTVLAVSGLVRDGSFGKSFTDPIIEILEKSTSTIKSDSIGRLLAVYSLTSGISSDRFRTLVESSLPLAFKLPDPISSERLNFLSLIPISTALIQIHKPKDQKTLALARRRIVFNEFLFLQLSLLLRRNELKMRTAPTILKSNKSNKNTDLVNKFLNLLPFTLTSAQKRVLQEIDHDLSLSEPMARLVQGDVGSGKTVIAISTLLRAVQANWQAALMAPTEVLAQQHYKNLVKWLPQLHVTVALLTGSTTNVRRSEILSNLSAGNLHIIVGTHALIEESVSFNRLGVVVVDEQHRFGVNQRNLLLGKGLQPHLLTMTATPIPRTLALSVHGDLDISHIDEMPPGRTAIKTRLISSTQRTQAYETINSRILLGQQVFYVLPLVEESEKLELRSAVDVFNELSIDIFPNFKIGLLHGKMNSKDKDSIIGQFRSGIVQLLVTTTVIEVGIDVPEATVMVIDNADRFGLAQLHQLRGRVGRGSNSSECILIDSDKSPLSKKRLEVLVSSSDGFEISEIDLRLRGPGQVLGTRQSGMPDFALANLIDDLSVLDLARSEAMYILKSDPLLSKNQLLKDYMELNKYSFNKNAQLN